jgi:hypothetical protein
LIVFLNKRYETASHKFEFLKFAIVDRPIGQHTRLWTLRRNATIVHTNIQLEKRNIALMHGHDTRLLDKSTRSGEWHIICHGHTHSPRHDIVGNTLVLNPGAISRTIYPSVATVDLESLEVTSMRL